MDVIAAPRAGVRSESVSSSRSSGAAKPVPLSSLTPAASAKITMFGHYKCTEVNINIHNDQ